MLGLFLVFGAVSAVGVLVPPPCPINSVLVALPVPGCQCINGFRGTLTLAPDQKSWIGSCAAISKPATVGNHRRADADNQELANADNQEPANAGYEVSDFALIQVLEHNMTEELAMNGLALKDVKADGNCLFRAIALGLFQDEELHGTVRRECHQWMSDNWFMFDGDLNMFDESGIEKYLDRLQRDGEMMDETAVIIASTIYKRHFKVVWYDETVGKARVWYSPPNDAITIVQPPIWLAYDQSRDHYLATVRKSL